MIKKALIITAALLAGALAFNAGAQNETISPDGTYMFVQRDTCDLYMDVYDPAPGSQAKINRPSSSCSEEDS